MPGLDQSALRRVNTAAVLRALAAGEADATLQALIGKTGLSRRTIELILSELVAEARPRAATVPAVRRRAP